MVLCVVLAFCGEIVYLIGLLWVPIIQMDTDHAYTCMLVLLHSVSKLWVVEIESVTKMVSALLVDPLVYQNSECMKGRKFI